jgi:Ribbon-helix-helix protein, copG family
MHLFATEHNLTKLTATSTYGYIRRFYMLSKRVEILLDPAEMEALRRYAKKAKKSVGALIRDAVKEKYLTPTPKERKEALKRLLSPERAISFPSWKKIKQELEDSMRRGIETD